MPAVLGGGEPAGPVIAGERLDSALLLGTGGLPHLRLIEPLLAATRPGLVTVSVRRTSSVADGGLLAALQRAGVRLLPNTAGCLSPARRCSPPAWLARRWAPTGSSSR